MLSSSHSKIHEPPVTGVSPRPTDQRGARKLRNTSYPVGADNSVTSCDLHVLVDEAAEPVSSERSDDRSGGLRGTAVGRVLME